MEDGDQKSSTPSSPWLAAFVLAASGGAIAALLVGFGTGLGLCMDTSVACNERRGLATAQFYVAAAGLIPVIVMIFAVVTKRRTLAATALTIALLTYATWIVLNDAAVHGWGEAMWLVP